jgi:pimeloyl-ACP methyl ester carboxylesterase
MLHHVAVAGGELAVDAPEAVTGSIPILAIHGISSQRRLWDWLRAADPALTASLVAPDLRGRADSFAVEGPSSIRQHAEDLVAVLDALGIERAHVCGMSMGGFVGVELAAAYPDRVSSLALVDGGLPMPRPGGGQLTPELLPVVFKDRLDRLEKPWASLDEYVGFFTGNTAPLLDPADPILRGNLAHDLDDHGFVRLSGQALLDDARDVFFGENRWQEVTVPTRLLYAEWSVGAGSPPAYTPEAVEAFAAQLPALVDSKRVAGVDHAASIMSDKGAQATAAALRDAIGG